MKDKIIRFLRSLVGLPNRDPNCEHIMVEWHDGKPFCIKCELI